MNIYFNHKLKLKVISMLSTPIFKKINNMI